MSLPSKVQSYFSRHPLVREALLWAIPALIFGAVLRLMLLSYSPYAYWGSDSKSFFIFAHDVLRDFDFDLDAKRRFVYPIFLLPFAILPGSPLRWLALIQAALGLATIVPMAYVVRKCLAGWKLWIVPVTVAYAGLPTMIWYEHELLADTLMFDAVVFSCAGWAAWVMAKNPQRASRLWWCFFVPFSILLLTKPAARFFLPGLVVAIVLTGAWRTLRWRGIAAAVAVFILSLFMGSGKQGSWLLYVTAFPLTQMDTPLHAEYKADIRDIVERNRANLDRYGETEEEAFRFLRNPGEEADSPLWRELGEDDDKRYAIYHDLAMEAIKAHPLLFLYIGQQRLIGSANMDLFNLSRFEADYFGTRFERIYTERRISESMLKMILGLSRDQPFPPYETIRKRLAPRPDSKAAVWLLNYGVKYGEHLRLVNGSFQNSSLRKARPSYFGWWLLVGAVLAMLGPHRRTLGAWALIMGGYLVGVYLVGVQHTRYFAPAWPIIFLFFAVVPDLLFQAARRVRERGRTTALPG